ncbi:MAG TPA: hypothetical protein VMT34_07180 [Aggregatilineales bacterium]|nr:hypothetical protein [Aggregatilineales bacterium]
MHHRLGWFWCCLGVLIAGCSSSATAATSTPFLFQVTWIPATATPILKLLRAPTLNATNKVIATLGPTLAALPVTSPDCYETPVGTLWCLGLFRNTLNLPIESVRVQVYLVTSDGLALAQRDAMVARRLLMPGETSPYGILFDTIPAGTAGPVAVVRDFTANPDTRLAALEVDGTSFDQRESVVQVNGWLANPHTSPVNDMSITVTLFDAKNRVTGYRQFQLTAPGTALKPGANMPFSITITPQGLGTNRVEVTGEGRMS